jgi:hypothetical protein
MSHLDTYLSVPQALSVVPGNGGIKGRTDKLKSVTVGSPESVYMALSFCFDLYRRLLYMAQPAGALREHIPPELAKTILKDDEAIDKADGWRGRAEAAQRIMLRLHGELSADWQKALERAASEARTEVHT